MLGGVGSVGRMGSRAPAGGLEARRERAAGGADAAGGGAAGPPQEERRGGAAHAAGLDDRGERELPKAQPGADPPREAAHDPGRVAHQVGFKDPKEAERWPARCEEAKSGGPGGICFKERSFRSRARPVLEQSTCIWLQRDPLYVALHGWETENGQVDIQIWEFAHFTLSFRPS